MNKFRCAAVLLGLVGAAMPAAGSIVLTTGLPVTETFDSLPSSGTTALSGVLNQHDALPGSTGFIGAKIGGSGTALNLVADAGTSNSGRLGSLGAVGSSERALGSLASGTTVAGFGVEIVNNTGFDMLSLQIDGFREQWRSSTSVMNVLTFASAVSGGTATSSNFMSDGSLVALASLDLVGEAPVASNGATDGNTLRVAITGTISTVVPNGASLYIRWTDVDNSGSDAALALDDMTLTPTLEPEPSVAMLLGFGSILALRRRRYAA